MSRDPTASGLKAFKLRLPDLLRDALEEEARANGRSLNSEIVQRLLKSPFPNQHRRK